MRSYTDNRNNEQTFDTDSGLALKCCKAHAKSKRKSKIQPLV